MSLLAGGARADWQWNESLSPHFVVYHESAWKPPGFVLNIERMHNRLRRDLGMFSPWMAKERLKLYLYTTQKSYVEGQFNPPAWSNGVAFSGKKLVAVHDQKDRAKLLQVISHETTHLLFEGYFQEVGKEPPSWLNEGLGMMEETDPFKQPERSSWYQAMAYMPRKDFFAMKEFVSINPTEDLKDDKKTISRWYVQAYSVVYFLYRQHSRLQFKSFCTMIRDGRSVEQALWSVYRYGSLEKFEKSWRAWLINPSHLKLVESIPAAVEDEVPEAAAGEKKAQGVRTSPSLRSMDGFKSLRD